MSFFNNHRRLGVFFFFVSITLLIFRDGLVIGFIFFAFRDISFWILGCFRQVFSRISTFLDIFSDFVWSEYVCLFRFILISGTAS